MKKFFVSSAIDYPSSPPHCGHLYEKICCDVVARWHRQKGEKVHFSTGLDCHGQKIQQKADQAKLVPLAFVQSMEPHYRKLCEDYDISFDDFILTTEERHKKVVYQIFKKIYDKGDIYKGEYEGLYCVDCETYYAPHEILEGNICPVHKTPLQTLKEESYFFKMSKYQPKLIELLKTDLLWPKERQNEILQRLNQPLRDLSISRTTVKWGIPFPIDDKHRFFVWMDALVNYLSTVDYPNQKYKTFWPADAHIIGRDIVWHHTVIWWSLLLSAGIELPRVVSHGFVNTETGDKMSKAAGNVIDPAELHKKFGTDTVRYFFMREIPFGFDGTFSEANLQARNNNELANGLGNLLNRTVALSQKKLSDKITRQKSAKKLTESWNPKKIENLLDNFEFNAALTEIFSFVATCNKYVNDKRPWEQSEKDAAVTLYNLVDALRVLAIALEPFIPGSCGKINEQLGLKKSDWSDAKLGLLSSTTVVGGAILFSKIEDSQIPKPEKPRARAVLVSVEKQVSDLGIKIAWGIVENARVKKKHEGLEKLKQKTVSEVNLKDKNRELIISEFENIYKKLKVSGVTNSVRNLDLLVQKGQLPQINTAVDCYNIVSLRHGLVVGCHDIDKLKGDIRFKIVNGSEKYVPLGSRENKGVKAGEFGVVDDAQVICRLDEKQCDETKVTEQTKHLVFYVQGNAKTDLKLLNAAATEIGELITKFCGGEFKLL